MNEPNPEARAAGAKLLRDGAARTKLVTHGFVAGRDGKTYIYVNNRLEGNALETIVAMLGQAKAVK